MQHLHMHCDAVYIFDQESGAAGTPVATIDESCTCRRACDQRRDTLERGDIFQYLSKFSVMTLKHSQQKSGLIMFFCYLGSPAIDVLAYIGAGDRRTAHTRPNFNWTPSNSNREGLIEQA
jgi:hypothetical protein